MYLEDIKDDKRSNNASRLPIPPNKVSPYKNHPKSTSQLNKSNIVKDVTNSRQNSDPNSMNSSPARVCSPEVNRNYSPNNITKPYINNISSSMNNMQRGSYYRDQYQDAYYRPESQYSMNMLKNQYYLPNQIDYSPYTNYQQYNNINYDKQNTRRSQFSTHTQESFVELSHLPFHAKASGNREDLDLISNKISSTSEQSLTDYKPYSNNGSSEYGEFDPKPPAHVLRPESQFYDERLMAQANLPSHVSSANINKNSQYASPSTNFDPSNHKMPTNNANNNNNNIKEGRSCFGFCSCSGKSCVVITTAVCFVIGLILFFLWIRIPGISPNSEFRFTASPRSTSNDTLSTFKTQLQIELRINNPNFYPLWLNELNGKVYNSGTENEIGRGNLKPVYVPILGEAYANYTIDINYYASNPQDKTILDILAACPIDSETVTRYPLTLNTIVEAKYNLFAWANVIPKDAFRRNLVCQ